MNDPDFTPNDIGVPERVGVNKPLTEAERADYYEKLDEVALDDVIF